MATSAEQVLHPGLYDVGDLGIGNDAISSLRVPSGWQVLLYEDSRFSGDRRGVASDTADLGGFNDRTSSIMITGPADRTPVMIFSDRQYGGSSQALWPGLYRDSDFQGPSVTYTSSAYNAGDRGFDDETSSILVEGP